MRMWIFCIRRWESILARLAQVWHLAATVRSVRATNFVKFGTHPITQSPSLIPPGILSSCNNLLVNQVKNPRDRDLVIASMHRSEKGFVDEGWRRFLASLPIARAVVKFGYSFDRAELEPCYIEPLRLDVKEPSDEEIVGRLG